MTLRELLTAHGLSAYVDAFEREHVGIPDLADLTDDDLRATLGMAPLMDRKRFRAMVASLSGSAPAPVLDSGATRTGSLATDPGATRMGTPPADAGATRMDAAPSWPTQIGNYRILGLVGQGGMGTVLRARHIVDAWAEKQGGDVAIKLIHPHLASDPAFQRRFIDEAGLGRSVSHAGLVPVYDVVADGAWLGSVMGFVSGEPLASRVRPGGLPVEEVLRLLGPVGETLDFLHAQGIVHRDVKPANVMVRADGRPVLLDLGIAKDTRGSAAPLTRAMTTLGTRAWMAPEQCIPGRSADAAVDRYAFGLLAYSLLAGRMPWPHDTEDEGILTLKALGDLEPLGEVRAGLLAHVPAAVHRMLSVAAGTRYPTCASFVEALRRDPEAEARVAAARAAQEKAEREAAERAAREAADRAARERAVREVQERAAQAAKERAEREARERADREAREATERAAREKAAREAAERAAREKREREAREATEHAARDKAAREAAERAAREKADREARQRADREAREKAEHGARIAAENSVWNLTEEEEAALLELQKLGHVEIPPWASPDHAARTERKTYRVRYQIAREVLVNAGFLGIGRTVEQRVDQLEEQFTMVVIPPCRFTMGSPLGEKWRLSDEPQHEVRLTRAYTIATTPVTQALFQAVLGTNPSMFKDGAMAPQRPVEQVSWYDAVRFCNAISATFRLRAAYEIGSGDPPNVRTIADSDGFRLPTEAEWECAARAGTAHKYAGGDDPGWIAWHQDNSGFTTHVVGEKRANVWGLHDLSGNVWEWCGDWYGDYASGVVTDPQGAASGSRRVDRGGGWEYAASGARVARRDSNRPGNRGCNLGFRLARTLC